jgi:DNA-binding GntR family transcriptional regulator
MNELERYLVEHQAEIPGGDSRLLREVAYEHLKDAIRYADLTPGVPLSENRISKALGISRTPVREAIQMLAQEGLIEIIPGRAVTIASRSIRDVLDVLQIRLLLEPDLIRLSTETINESQLEILWDSLLKMETAVENEDRAAWSKADTTWHEILSEACPNDLLGELVLQMRNRIHRYANVDHKLKIQQLRNGTAEHRDIVQAIAAKDSHLAETLMRGHLEKLRKNLFDQLIYA